MDRNNVIDYVERLRTKPEHIRRRIAVGTTVGITGVVAAGWLAALVFSGSLSLAPSNTNAPTLAAASDEAQTADTSEQSPSPFSQLLGAVGFSNASSAPASITVVNASTSTPSTDDVSQSPTGGNQTVIPF